MGTGSRESEPLLVRFTWTFWTDLIWSHPRHFDFTMESCHSRPVLCSVAQIIPFTSWLHSSLVSFGVDKRRHGLTPELQRPAL